MDDVAPGVIATPPCRYWPLFGSLLDLCVDLYCDSISLILPYLAHGLQYCREFEQIYLREIHVLNFHVKQETWHKMLCVMEYSPTCPSKAITCASK
jgi:hypothetical protein